MDSLGDALRASGLLADGSNRAKKKKFVVVEGPKRSELQAAVAEGTLSPKPPCSENPLGDQREFSSWERRYREWWKSLGATKERVSAAKNPISYIPLQRGFVEKRVNEYLKKRFEERLELYCFSYEDVLHLQQSLDCKQKKALNEAIIGSKLAWEWYGIRNGASKPTIPLTQERNLSESAVLGLAGKSLTQEELFIVKSEIRRRFPCKERNICVASDGHTIVYPDGRIEIALQWEAAPKEKRVAPLSIVPNRDGWFAMEAKRWVGQEVGTAWALLQAHRAGSILIPPEIMAHYRRHPKKGYPSFYFRVKAGKKEKSFEIPIWRPKVDEGWLAEHFDAIALLEKYQITIPRDAYWLNVKIGNTKAGKPRMVSADKGHRKTFAALFTKRSESKSRGKHGWERLLVTGDKKNAKAATVLWDTTVFSRGGRSNAQQLVVWIETGGFLPLSNGSNIRFDGMRVEEVEEISLRK